VPKKAQNTTRYKIRRQIPDPVYSLDEIIRPHVPKSPRTARNKEQFAIAEVETVAPTEAQPFLKWVGGKSQLLAQFDEFSPRKLTVTSSRSLAAARFFFISNIVFQK
jgi:hypothetical protein